MARANESPPEQQPKHAPPLDPRRALEEIRLVATMVKGFGERMTDAHAADLAGRLLAAIPPLEACVSARQTAVPTSPPDLAEPTGPTSDGLPRNRDPPPHRDHRASFVPMTPSSTSRDGGTSPSVTLPRQYSPRSALVALSASGRKRSTGLTSAPVPTPPDRSADAVLKIAARTLVATGSSGERATAEHREMSTAIGAAVFAILDATLTHLHAEGGAIYVPIADEMVSIATIFPGRPVTPQPLVKHIRAGSVTGSVLSSGIMVHQRGPGLDDNNRRVQAQLLVPIVATSERRLGVLQILAKYRGAAIYTEADESFSVSVAYLLAALLDRYPVQWAGPLYDPVSLMKQSPFVAHVAVPDIQDVIPQVMHATTPQILVHRSDESVALAKRFTLAGDAAALGQSPMLREVQCYISNLSDCWRRAVQMNIEYERTEQERLAEMRRMREELRVARLARDALEDRLRTERLDVADYRAEYTTLKEELERFLARKRVFDP